MMWPNTLVLRNIAEQLRRGLRMVTEAPDPVQDDRFSPGMAIRLPPGLVRPENAKRAPGTRDVSQIGLIVGHVTDVTGGFGVQKWGPDGWRTWERRLYSGNIPGPLTDGLLADIEREFGQLRDTELARVLALCSRYAQLPYHRLTSRKLGEVINRPFEHRTWASSAGNGGIALAMDCGHREDIDDAFAEAGRSMVRRACDHLRAAGSTATIRYAPHGCFSRSRWNDTHREAHLRVFKPAILELQGFGEDIRIDYEAASGGGRQLTTRDDPDAHFNEKGRRIRTPEGELL